MAPSILVGSTPEGFGWSSSASDGSLSWAHLEVAWASLPSRSHCLAPIQDTLRQGHWRIALSYSGSPLLPCGLASHGAPFTGKAWCWREWRYRRAPQSGSIQAPRLGNGRYPRSLATAAGVKRRNSGFVIKSSPSACGRLRLHVVVG